MKYNLIRIYTTADGTVGRETEVGLDFEVAKANYYEYLKRRWADPNLVQTMCMVIDDNGKTYLFSKE